MLPVQLLGFELERILAHSDAEGKGKTAFRVVPLREELQRVGRLAAHASSAKNQKLQNKLTLGVWVVWEKHAAHGAL